MVLAAGRRGIRVEKFGGEECSALFPSQFIYLRINSPRTRAGIFAGWNIHVGSGEGILAA
jgi:hypothetical protein